MSFYNAYLKFLIVFIALLTVLHSQEGFTPFNLLEGARFQINDFNVVKKNKTPQPHIFETPKYKVLLEIYLEKYQNRRQAKYFFERKLSLLGKEEYPGALSKYTPEDATPRTGSRYKLIRNNELWLSVFQEKYLIIYIDDGFDGFIYAGEDKDMLVDRVAILPPLYEQRTRKKIIDISDVKTDTENVSFSIPGTTKSLTINPNKYREIFCHNIKILESTETTNDNFIPFEGTALSSNYCQ